MSPNDFLGKVERLRRLIALQSSLRWVLRALWVGLAVTLAAWALHQLTGWLPSPLGWVLCGVVAGLIPLLGIFSTWPRSRSLVWSMDRVFGLQQQISTAYQEAQRTSVGPLTGELIDESGLKLEQLRARILKKGWFLGRDLVSLLIVGILGGLIYATGQVIPEIPQTIPAAAIEALPVAAAEPKKEDVIQPEAPQSGDQSQGGSQGGQTPLTSEDMTALMEAAQKMGQELSQQPETSPLGEALESLDIQKATEQLEELADQAGTLSEEAQDQLAQAMQAGADSLEGTNLDELAESLGKVQESLENNDPAAAAGDLEQLSQDLQEVVDQLAGEGQGGQPTDAENPSGSPSSGASTDAGTEGGNRELGQPEELPRLQEESDTLDLSSGAQDTTDIPGALKTGQAKEAGQQTTLGSGSEVAPSSFESFRGVIIPFNFQWTWKYVVSSYFQPIQK